MRLAAVKNVLRVGGFRFLGAFLCGAAFLIYRSASSHLGWVTISSPEGGFEILFPTKPEQQTVTGHMNDPRFQSAALFSAQKENVGYEVGYSDDFADTANNFGPEQRLDAARNGCLETTQGTFVSEINISTSGVPGREIIFMVNGARCRARVYVSGARRYVVEVLGDAGDNPSAARFFESFRLLTPTAQISQISTSQPMQKSRQRLTIAQISAVYQETMKTYPSVRATLQEFSRVMQTNQDEYDFSEGMVSVPQ